MRRFNPWICQFDPELHTFAYVRKRSAFLLTSIVSAAAKVFNPSLRPSLQAHADRLFGESFSQGTKSAEVIHAILVLTYWKEPEDTRAWLSIGYVIRMCMELGWHKLHINKRDNSLVQAQQDQALEASRRALRDSERLWLLLFVYDRR